MPSILKKLDGVINNIFSIGLKGDKTTITSTASGLNVDNNIDVGDHAIKTTATPIDDNDVVTLSYVTQHTADCARIFYHDFTSTSSVSADLHNIAESCIIKNVVVDVLSTYNSDAELTVSIGGINLISSASVNLNSIGQYHTSTFNLLDSAGDLNISITNATTVGKLRVYIEFINLV